MSNDYFEARREIARVLNEKSGEKDILGKVTKVIGKIDNQAQRQGLYDWAIESTPEGAFQDSKKHIRPQLALARFKDDPTLSNAYMVGSLMVEDKVLHDERKQIFEGFIKSPDERAALIEGIKSSKNCVVAVGCLRTLFSECPNEATASALIDTTLKHANAKYSGVTEKDVRSVYRVINQKNPTLGLMAVARMARRSPDIKSRARHGSVALGRAAADFGRNRVVPAIKRALKVLRLTRRKAGLEMEH